MGDQHGPIPAPQFTLKRRSFLAGASAFALAAPLCIRRAAAQSTDLAGRKPKSLEVLVDATVGNLDLATNVEWDYGLHPVYKTLTQLDGTETLKVASALATARTRNDDGSSWTFTLVAGAGFQDGTVCDAAAVRAAVKAAVTRLAALPTGQQNTWKIADPAKQIVGVDATAIRFDLGVARRFFDRQVSSQYGFWIAGPTAAPAHSKGPADMGSEYLQSHPVGSGPCVLAEQEPGQAATFAMNDAYRGGWAHPHCDTVDTQAAPLSASCRQFLESGQADITLTSEPEDLVALKADSRFTLSDTPAFVVRFFSFASDGVLASHKARQAMCHAFDHAAYIKDVTLGTADLPTSVFPSVMHGRDGKSRLLPFDQGKARFARQGGNRPRHRVEGGLLRRFREYRGADGAKLAGRDRAETDLAGNVLPGLS